MTTPKKILFVCHRHPFEKNGGAEMSVSIIMRHFVSLGHAVTALVLGAQDGKIHGVNVIGVGVDYQIKCNDIVFTWGSVASGVVAGCIQNNKPYILMVRWWRNVSDNLQDIGNLMEREIAPEFKAKVKHFYDHAKAVITNNYYSAAVIEKHYGRKALVSYVPILGEANKINNPNGHIVMVSPDKNLNERSVFLDIARQMPNTKFMVVNCPQYDWEQYAKLRNITVKRRVDNMTEIWKQAKMVLSPVYMNDICGTLRVNIEAMQHGVPVITNDRCGMWEKIPNIIPDNANTERWVRKIVEVSRDYDNKSKEAIQVFNEYDTEKQLKVFESVL